MCVCVCVCCVLLFCQHAPPPSTGELELVHRILSHVKRYNVHLNDTLDANITLLKASPGNERAQFDFAEAEPVQQLLKVVAEDDYRAFFAEFCVTQNFLVSICSAKNCAI